MTRRVSMLSRLTAKGSRALKFVPALVAAISFGLSPVSYAAAATQLPNTQVMQLASRGGGGSAAALPINFTEAAAAADALTPLPPNPSRLEFNRGNTSTLPSAPTIGTRTQATTSSLAIPQTSTSSLATSQALILPC